MRHELISPSGNRIGIGIGISSDGFWSLGVWELGSLGLMMGGGGIPFRTGHHSK